MPVGRFLLAVRNGDQKALEAMGSRFAEWEGQAALSTQTGTQGGYTVPEEFLPRLLALATENAVVRPRATVIPMTSRSVQVPCLDATTVPTAGDSAFLGGLVARWTEEASSLTETEPTFRQVELVAHELSAYAKVYTTVMQDNAVGLEAHGSPATAFVQNVVGSMPSAIGKPMMVKAGVDRLSALQLAIDGVRRGGTISVVGVYGGNADPMPMLKIFDKQLTMRFGQANVHRWFDDILPLAEADDDPLGLGDFATHRGPLTDAAELYDLFKKKDEGCVKVVLRP